MDCIIPGHSVRTFAASVSCLSKIGKEAYLSFDPLEGLTLRSLNDAKSAYGSFRFGPSFFERCSSPPQPARRRSGSRHGMRTGLNARVGSRSRSRDQQSESNDDLGEHGDDSDDDGRFLCRASLRIVHSVLRTRKGVVSLRIRSLGHMPDCDDNNDDECDMSANAGGLKAQGGKMQLSFEFVTSGGRSGGSGGTLRFVHRVHVSDADGVAAVAPREGASELVCAPSLLLRLLEPLWRTAEVALTVDDVGKTVAATSFHHGDGGGGTAASGAGESGIASGQGQGNNAVLNAAAAALLKTETSIGTDEFLEYTWKDDRILSQGGCEGGDEEGESEDGATAGSAPPASVNETVTLVFGIKEAKAMLQFCSSADQEGEMDAIVSFHWGGRPFIIDAEDEAGSFRAELILATLDHRLLGSRTASAGSQKARRKG